ncbi:hypothetical protein [Cellulosimicrobium cellulans]|uniref:hypothetical protein n=1 Tax=Cellulosimicrobium cellulans TaxID=1710 RepID=UPI00382A91CE
MVNVVQSTRVERVAEGCRVTWTLTSSPHALLDPDAGELVLGVDLVCRDGTALHWAVRLSPDGLMGTPGDEQFVVDVHQDPEDMPFDIDELHVGADRVSAVFADGGRADLSRRAEAASWAQVDGAIQTVPVELS